MLRTKTSKWALDNVKAQRNEAINSLQIARLAVAQSEDALRQEALCAAQKACDEVEIITAPIIQSNGLSRAIIRCHTNILEYHRKTGYDDALGHAPKYAIKNAIIMIDDLLDPDTCA